MSRTTVFRSNRTQAVRLAKDVALPESVTEVEIRAIGDVRVILPVRRDWRDWWTNATPVSDDFLSARDEPAAQEREW